MSLQWSDNFTDYGIDTDINGLGVGSPSQGFMLNGLYADTWGAVVQDPDPNADGPCWTSGFGQGQYLRKVLSSGQTTVGLAVRVWMNSLPASNNNSPSWIWRNSGGSACAGFRINSDGSISAGTFNEIGQFTILASTPGPVIVANAWQHVEALFVLDASGSIEIRIEATPKLTFTGNTIGFYAVPVTSVTLNGGGSLTKQYLKDFTLYDGLGSYNNDFIGTVQVIDLNLTSDVDLNWTPSTGTTGFNLLNTVPPDDADNYISAAEDPFPDPAEFTLTDLPDDVTSVRGIMTLVRASKIDGGDGNIQVAMGHDGDYDNGANRPISTAFTYWYDFSEEDPSTNLPWSPQGTNEATIRLNRTV